VQKQSDRESTRSQRKMSGNQPGMGGRSTNIQDHSTLEKNWRSRVSGETGGKDLYLEFDIPLKKGHGEKRQMAKESKGKA